MAAIIDNSAIQAVFASPQSDGAFEAPVRDYLGSVGALRPMLLLAFAPKSAGTYFRQAALHAIGGQLIRLCHAQGGRDGVPYLPNALAACLDADAPASVTHMHMQAFASNRHFITALGLKPVIMIRNIPDMLASFLDMLEADPVARMEGLNCRIPDGFCEMDRDTRLDFMIDAIAPWYASYYATWKVFADQARGTVCVLRYGDFCINPAEALQRAITHAGFVVTRLKCTRSLEEVWGARESYRFNKGIAGRGRDYFSHAHMARLARLLSYYPEITPWLSLLLG